MPFGPFLMESGGLSDGRRPQSRYASSEKSQSSSSTEPEDLGLRFPVRPASKLLCGSENVSMSLHSLSSARSDSPPLSVADRPLSLNVPVGRSATLEVRSASAPDHNCADVVTSQPQPVRKESLMSAESTGQQSAAELVKLDPGGDLYVLPKYSRPPKLRSATVHPYPQVCKDVNSDSLAIVADCCDLAGEFRRRMKDFCYRRHQ